MEPNAAEPNDAIANAPGTIELGGRTYLVGQASHSDLIAIRKRLRSKMPEPMSMLAQMMGDPSWKILSPEVQRDIQREAATAAIKKKPIFTEEQVFELLDQHPDVVAFFAWKLIRKHHPETTFESLLPHFTEDNAAELLVELYEQSGMKGAEKN